MSFVHRGDFHPGEASLVVLLPMTLQTVAADEGASPLRELSAFRSLQVWLTLATAAIDSVSPNAPFSFTS